MSGSQNLQVGLQAHAAAGERRGKLIILSSPFSFYTSLRVDWTMMNFHCRERVVGGGSQWCDEKEGWFGNYRAESRENEGGSANADLFIRSLWRCDKTREAGTEDSSHIVLLDRGPMCFLAACCSGPLNSARWHCAGPCASCSC